MIFLFGMVPISSSPLISTITVMAFISSVTSRVNSWGTSRPVWEAYSPVWLGLNLLCKHHHFCFLYNKPCSKNGYVTVMVSALKECCLCKLYSSICLRVPNTRSTPWKNSSLLSINLVVNVAMTLSDTFPATRASNSAWNRELVLVKVLTEDRGFEALWHKFILLYQWTERADLQFEFQKSKYSDIFFFLN